MKFLTRLGNMAYALVGVYAGFNAMGLPIDWGRVISAAVAFFILCEVTRDIWREKS